MPSFSGLNHLSLTVTDLDRSQSFYCDVLGFMLLLDFGEGRVLIHRGTSFLLAIVTHAGQSRRAFTETVTGLDHIGLSAASREELESWVEVFEAAGVTYTPIREMPFGLHLNFRDPDGIPLELHVPNDIALQGYDELRRREVPREEIDRRLRATLD